MQNISNVVLPLKALQYANPDMAIPAKFPPIDECFERISRERPRELQKAFVKNYLGNVLHDYFDESRVRAEFPSLAVDTEGTLRTGEAAVISETVFAQLGG